MIRLIVAMTKDRVIGKDGKIPWNLPQDMKLFKEITSSHHTNIVVMGSKTYDSLNRPNGLPNRHNIVITSNPEKYPHLLVEGSDVVCWQSLDMEVLYDLGVCGHNTYIIGGAQIYQQALDTGKLDELIISFVDGDYEGDTYFPEINWNEWKETFSQQYDGFVLKKFSNIAKKY
jgi:dihydrofolate reductase